MYIDRKSTKIYRYIDIDVDIDIDVIFYYIIYMYTHTHKHTHTQENETEQQILVSLTYAQLRNRNILRGMCMHGMHVYVCKYECICMCTRTYTCIYKICMYI